MYQVACYRVLHNSFNNWSAMSAGYCTLAAVNKEWSTFVAKILPNSEVYSTRQDFL